MLPSLSVKHSCGLFCSTYSGAQPRTTLSTAPCCPSLASCTRHSSARAIKHRHCGQASPGEPAALGCLVPALLLSDLPSAHVNGMQCGAWTSMAKHTCYWYLRGRISSSVPFSMIDTARRRPRLSSSVTRKSTLSRADVQLGSCIGGAGTYDQREEVHAVSCGVAASGTYRCGRIAHS